MSLNPADMGLAHNARHRTEDDLTIWTAHGGKSSARHYVNHDGWTIRYDCNRCGWYLLTPAGDRVDERGRLFKALWAAKAEVDRVAPDYTPRPSDGNHGQE
ncbi:MAG: hypothetical protein L0I76_23120 [Pseudonocardia sp.]|nr:hypothetical protein [Pseudonocardia sp.]